MSLPPAPRRSSGPLATAHRLAPLAGRARWGLAEQALSSATNFALGILIARTVSLAEFGAFSLAFSGYLLVVNMTRAFPMQPVAIRFSAVPPAEWRRASAAALGTAVAAGVVAGLAFLLLGLTLGEPNGLAFVALGLTLPGLVLQDGWRSSFFAAGRGSLAFTNDAVWAIILIPSLIGLELIGHTSVFWLTLAWGGAATIAALVGILQGRFLPRPRRAMAWWREQRDLGPRYLAEAAASTGANQAAIYALGIVAGLATVGAIRAGLLLFGPLQILLTGIGLILVPEGVRALQRSVRQLVRAAVAVSVVLGFAAVSWGIVLLMIPESVGTTVLGEAWTAAAQLLVPLTVAYAGLMATSGPVMILRALANARRSLRATILASAGNVFLVIGGAAGGGLGGAWGAAAAAWLGLIAWSRQSSHTVRDAGAETGPGTRDAVPPSRA